jgi:hypothetical protein
MITQHLPCTVFPIEGASQFIFPGGVTVWTDTPASISLIEYRTLDTDARMVCRWDVTDNAFVCDLVRDPPR